MKHLNTYTTALFDLTKEENPIKVYNDLLSIQNLLSEMGELSTLLYNLDSRDIILDTLSEFYSNVVIRYLEVLLEDNCLQHYAHIVDTYRSMIIREDIHHFVKVMTKTPLDTQAKHQLETHYKDKFESVSFTYEVKDTHEKGISIMVDENLTNLTMNHLVEQLVGEVKYG